MLKLNHHQYCKGKLTHLGKNLWMVLVLFLLMTLHTSDEIDQFDEFYEEFEKSQLVLILD
jgi:hypothetical protein